MRKIQELTRSKILQNDDEVPVYHGGDLAAARRLFPGAPEPWIDLSTGINPEPYPFPALPAEVFSRLPEPSQLTELEAAAARRYGAPPAADIVAAPGTQALIQLLPRLYEAKSVGILGFTYGEYARVWQEIGLAPQVVETLGALCAFDLAIIVNPNNPDGRLMRAEDLSALAQHLARKGGLLVVDEAFMDLLRKDHSLVPILPEQGALVLRSFGKTYGLPGIRLGFAVTNAALAEKLRHLLGPWAVSGPAIAIGHSALADDLWLKSLAEQLKRQAAIIDAAMALCGAKKIGATMLFRLFTHADAENLFQRFGREGVLLRRFPVQPTWLRVGLAAEAYEKRLLSIAERISKDA
ncbi:MAG: threonine-phosphate decarboxylase CobD [Methylovirgula sp.]